MAIYDTPGKCARCLRILRYTPTTTTTTTHTTPTTGSSWRSDTFHRLNLGAGGAASSNAGGGQFSTTASTIGSHSAHYPYSTTVGSSSSTLMECPYCKLKYSYTEYFDSHKKNCAVRLARLGSFRPRR